MDITKYITNKDLTVTNDDIDIAKLTNDLRKGYELSSEVNKKINSAVTEANKTSASTLSDLQSKYDDLEKRNTDLTEKNKQISLERTMVEYGFKKEQFDEVSKMRSSLYGDETDNDKAISQIKERFKDTYFPTTKEPEVPKVPEEGKFNGQVGKADEIKVTRKTNIKDLFIKK